MNFRLAVPIIALAASLPAQALPCLSFNDSNANVSNAITGTPFVGLNPGARAYQFSPASAVPVASAAIFTGSPIRADYMRLEIWDENPIAMEPGRRLSVGTMSSPLSTTAQWLGTNFDNPAILLPGTNYWFVWVEPGSSTVAEEPNGSTMLQRRTRTASNPWGAAVLAAPKIRLFCNLLEGVGLASSGTPCRLSSGGLPTAFSNDSALAGNPAFGIEATNLPAGATAWLLIGLDPLYPSIPLGPSFPLGCSLGTEILVTLSDTAGFAEIGDQPSTPRPVPFGFVRFNLPLFGTSPGAFASFQVFTMDGGSPAPFPFASSNVVRLTIQ